MDILINNVPFNVEFIVYQPNKENEIKSKQSLNRFSLSPTLDFIENLELTEYDNLAVKFSSYEKEINFKARLYMDCFEYIDEIKEVVELDENELEYITLQKETMLHRHYNNDVGSPLIPGVYRLKVLWDKTFYYSQILINPKNLELKEHNQMIYEIESHALGLARDWVRKNSSLDILDEIGTIDPTFLDLATLLLKNEAILRKAMNVILKSPYTDLTKTYNLTAISKSKKVDSKSLQLYQVKNSSSLNSINFSKDTKIYSYSFEDNHNNMYNFYLIKIIKDFRLILKKAKLDIAELKNYIDDDLRQLNHFKKENNIGDTLKINNREKQLRKINQLGNKIENFDKVLLGYINRTFLRILKVPIRVILPQGFIKTPGYNIFYKVHKLLYGNLETKIEDLYDYNWKSSELLYEYWCFIKFIELLIDLNFTPIEGWIYKDSVEDEGVSIPAIPDNTYVIFSKEDITLNLMFNSEIGKTPEEAKKKKSPYWIRSHRNKPDFRLDVYVKDDFIKTIILDSKYSPADRVWNKKYANSSNQSKVVEQLKMYVNMVIKLNTRNDHPVEEVIVLCPTLINDNCIIDIDENHLVTIVTLKPGMDNEELKCRIHSLIYSNNYS